MNILFKKPVLQKVIKFIVGTVSIFFIILYISTNSEFVEIYKNINIYYLYIVLSLIILRIFLQGIQNYYFYKIADVHLTIMESINLYLKSIVGNYVSFFQPGSGYKIAYLKLQHKLSIKDYFFLNIGLTIYRISLYTFLILIYLVFKEYLKFVWLALTLSSCIFIFYFFKRYLKKLFYKKFELNFKIFSFMSIIITIQLLINSYIFYLYFKILYIDNSISDILVFFLIGTISDIVKITPGNIGFRESILVLFQSLHNILPNEILAVSFFARFTEVVIYSILTLIFVFFPIKKIKSKSESK